MSIRSRLKTAASKIRGAISKVFGRGKQEKAASPVKAASTKSKQSPISKNNEIQPERVPPAQAMPRADIRKRRAAEKKEAQARRNSIFLQQLKIERAGDTSAMFGGEVRDSKLEQIFWASTQDLWIGVDPGKRWEAVMKAMGTDSAEEAFRRVIDANPEAIKAARESVTDKTMTSARDSTPWIGAIVSFYEDYDESGNRVVKVTRY